jgi:hypothetical protein
MKNIWFGSPCLAQFQKLLGFPDNRSVFAMQIGKVLCWRTWLASEWVWLGERTNMWLEYWKFQSPNPQRRGLRCWVQSLDQWLNPSCLCNKTLLKTLNANAQWSFLAEHIDVLETWPPWFQEIPRREGIKALCFPPPKTLHCVCLPFGCSWVISFRQNCIISIMVLVRLGFYSSELLKWKGCGNP